MASACDQVDHMHSLYDAILWRVLHPLKIRMANHRYSIRKGLDLPVAKHFNRPKHTLKDMKVMPIEKIKNDDKNKRKQREAFWIYELRTLSPEGVNVLDSINLN